MANYTSDFSGQHNDDYDSRINALLNTITDQQNTIITLNNHITTLENNLNTLSNNFAILNTKVTAAPSVLWTGDAHAAGAILNLNDSIMNYKKIYFIFNVIPSRAPAYDLCCDQPWYPEIHTGSAWDVTAYGNSIALCTLVRNSNTQLKIATYSKRDPSYMFDPGIVKVIGFKTY